MNLIIVQPEDYIAADTVKLSGRRHSHIVQTLRKMAGDSCKIGQYNGLIGTGSIVEQSAEYTVLALNLTEPPPAPCPITLLMALPRPKTLRKVLHYAATLGVKNFHFFGCFKVEKSYWSSPFLTPEYLAEQELLALEQCVDTVPWHIEFHRFFKPFAEDVLPQLVLHKEFLVCHPTGELWQSTDYRLRQLAVCIGPEGGFTDYEVNLLAQSGGRCISLGERILRTENAVPFLLGKLL